VPPNYEEAGLYFLERGHSNAKLEAEKFVDYWQSIGWMRGKTKMKDWKASANTWMKNNFGASNGKFQQNIVPMPAANKLYKAPPPSKIDREEGKKSSAELMKMTKEKRHE